MSNIQFEPAMQYALRRLETELSPKLYYHSLVHTRDDVVPATERLAAMEGVVGEDLQILLTGAYFHDLGFVELLREDKRAYRSPNSHEDVSAQIAYRVLPDFGYAPSHLKMIEGIILATKIPQRPITLLDKILADADLDSLGRDDFWSTSLALREELAAFGTLLSEVDWFKGQLRFLTIHKYFTLSAVQLRATKKAQNIREVSRLLRSLYGLDPESVLR